MPNRQVHTKAGALSGLAISAARNSVRQIQRIDSGKQEKFDWWSLVGSSIKGGLLGAVFANLPDTLEPATSPRHRAFFHSITFLVLLTILLGWVIESDRESSSEEIAWPSWMGIVSHLLLDSQTPIGLPLV